MENVISMIKRELKAKKEELRYFEDKIEELQYCSEPYLKEIEQLEKTISLLESNLKT